jgi:4-diphosphocytidyl-2-C-methyl-D-erythritol kinase
MTLVARAPGKVNRCLFLGAPRADGLHPLVSVVQPLSLADVLTLEPGDGRDGVVCPGVEGPNLVEKAIAAFRDATGWDGPAVSIHVEKRVPVAAGMGGGSGDAAAALRLLAAHTRLPLPAHVAMRLGADVPSQLEPRRCLMTGAGEHVRPLPGPPAEAYVVVPSPHALSTPDVFREADRLGLGRSPGELADLEAAGEPFADVNDLEPAAISLLPEIEASLAALRAAGARTAMVSGSGPTTYGVFATREAAAAAAAEIPGSVVAEPVDSAYGRVGGPYNRDA